MDHIFFKIRARPGSVKAFEYLHWTRLYSHCGSFEMKCNTLDPPTTVDGALGNVDLEMGEAINRIVAGMLQLLVIFGVLNNPTDAGHF